MRCATLRSVGCAGWAVLAWLAPLQVGAAALEPDEIFERVSPSVWTVSSFDAHARRQALGSAVAIGPGRLVTQCHVIDSGVTLAVQRENVRHAALPGPQDPERDLCELEVPGLDAPAVEIAGTAPLRVGARVYAIGSPRGLELTLSDGLISALRRDEAGAVVYIQTTAPISPGSSGGGLFDAEGRLIGITTHGGREAQNLNFAVPASLIGEIRARAQARATRPPPSPAARTPRDGTREVGDWFEYRLTDGLTGIGRTIHLTVDRVSGDRVIFNGGSRVESRTGELLENTAPALGLFDALTVPGGWAALARTPGSVALKFQARDPIWPVRFDLQAVVGAAELRRIDTREYRVVRMELTGWSGQLQLFPYKATVVYAPELDRVVHFAVEKRNLSRMFEGRETLELVRAGNQ